MASMACYRDSLTLSFFINILHHSVLPSLYMCTLYPFKIMTLSMHAVNFKSTRKAASFPYVSFSTVN
jgi:hypothetical protein